MTVLKRSASNSTIMCGIVATFRVRDRFD